MIERIVELGEGIADLATTDEGLEPFDMGWVVDLPLGKRREFHRVIRQEDRLDLVRADELLEQLVHDARPDRPSLDIRPGGASDPEQVIGVPVLDIVDTGFSADRLPERFARPGRRDIDLLAAIDKRWLAVHGDGGVDDQGLHRLHHRLVIAVRLIELEHREFRGVIAVDPLVPEILADLVDTLVAADEQPLQVQLVRDAKIKGLPERVVEGREGPGGGTAVERLQHGGLDLEVAAVVQEPPDRRDHPGAHLEYGANGSVGDEVDVALAIADLDILQAVPLLRRRIQRLRQHRQRFDAE